MEKSEKLVELITPLFLEKGYWNLRVDDIARELNISKKTLYVYFDNKKDIIWQVIQNNLKVIEEIVLNAENESDNAIQASVKFLDEFYNFIGTEQDKRNLSELKKYYPEILTSYKDSILALIRKMIQENYKRGIEEGLYKDEFAPDYVGRFFSVIYLGNRTLPLPKNNSFSFNKLRLMSVKIIMYGMVTEEGKILLDELYESYTHLNS